MDKALRIRVVLAVASVAALIAVFLFQRTDVSRLLGMEKTFWSFVVNRSVRFLINDALTILLIFALFGERKYVVFSIWVQVFGLVFLLIPYFIIKFNFPSYNGPLISFLHRLILNPTLLLLLIPAFYYQQKHHKI